MARRTRAAGTSTPGAMGAPTTKGDTLMADTPQPHPEPEAPRSAEDARADEFMTTRVLPWLQERFGDAWDADIIQVVLLRPLLDLLARRLVAQLGEDPVQLAATIQAIGRILTDNLMHSVASQRHQYLDALRQEPPGDEER